MSFRVHRGVVALKLATTVFMLGSAVTLTVLTRAQGIRPVGERVAVAESQIETNKNEITTLRAQMSAQADQVSTMRGMGIGAVALLGVLDTVQLILIKRSKPA